MIWQGGRILRDDELRIAADDRAFEHGLGLFETFRTWSGWPIRIEAHRDRMLGSARELGLAVRPDDWPTAPDVARLLAAEGATGDRVIRVTASGGTASDPSIVWMTTRALPPPTRPDGLRVRFGPWVVARSDPMARHKSLNYWSRRLAFERIAATGRDEVLSLADGRIWEGSRTNLFVVAGDRLATPAASGPIVPGILRGRVLALAPSLGLAVAEVDGFDPAAFEGAAEVFLTNSVRGLMPVAEVAGPDDRVAFRAAPGPWTARLQTAVREPMGADR